MKSIELSTWFGFIFIFGSPLVAKPTGKRSVLFLCCDIRQIYFDLNNAENTVNFEQLIFVLGDLVSKGSNLPKLFIYGSKMPELLFKGSNVPVPSFCFAREVQFKI